MLIVDLDCLAINGQKSIINNSPYSFGTTLSSISLATSAADLPRIMHEAFRIASTGRPGPVVIDVPKDVQFASAPYRGPEAAAPLHSYRPRTAPDPRAIAEAAHLIASAKRPETRMRRVDNACAMLAAGKRRVCCFDRSGFYSKSFSSPKAAI